MVSRAHADAERVQADTLVEWTAWLEANHERPDGVWLVSWKKASGRQTYSYEDAVVEALRVGWVDSVAQPLDDDRAMLWFAPRRPGSGWSKPNKERIARLEADGRLLAAGRAVIERAKADGTWTLLDAAEALEEPDDLTEAFGRHPGSADRWAAFPPSARKAILQWIVLAKRPDTRAKRIEETASLAAKGERANEWKPKRS